VEFRAWGGTGTGGVWQWGPPLNGEGKGFSRRGWADHGRFCGRETRKDGHLEILLAGFLFQGLLKGVAATKKGDFKVHGKRAGTGLLAPNFGGFSPPIFLGIRVRGGTGI